MEDFDENKELELDKTDLEKVKKYKNYINEIMGKDEGKDIKSNRTNKRKNAEKKSDKNVQWGNPIL